METIIASVIEKSLVGGAFIYLLYMFTTKFNDNLRKDCRHVGTRK
jgi:hypothetical protein